MSDCRKNFHQFCYMCGRFTIMPNKRKISTEIAEIYEQYFNIPVNQNVDWVPNIACISCVMRLNDWKNGRHESMPYGVPMIWSEPINHETNKCYVCVNRVFGLNKKKSLRFVYKKVQSAQTPLPHSDAVPIPKKPSPTEEYIPPTFISEPEFSMSVYQPSNVTPPCNHIEISQDRLEKITRQPKLSKRRTIFLTQQLRAVNILEIIRLCTATIFVA